MTATGTAGAAAPANLRALPPRPEETEAAEQAAEAAAEAARPGILRLDPVDPAAKQQREVMVYIGDKPVTVLRNPPAGLAIEYLEQQRQFGPLLSQSWLLRTMLGEDGYQAFTTYPKLKTEHLRFVLAECRAKVMAALTDQATDPKEQP